MINLVLSTLWESFYAQVGIAGLILIAAVAAWIYVPLPGPRHVAVGIATGCAVFIFTATHFYIEGVHYEKAQWDAAETAAADRAAKARADAEREIANAPTVVRPPSGPEPDAVDGAGGRLARILHPSRPAQPRAGGVRNDRNDRDSR
jgi:hypothetical protein